ncbi:MAG: spermidine synthase [Actinomycetia bacterium]|nr:spermidine synthase [Actinomycetes bacterium]
MAAQLEFLDAQQTPMGVISLRRRHDPVSGQVVYEAKLDDEFLMSSLFTAAEEEVARLALAEIDGDELDVVVGGLGLGYTAHTVLADPRVRSLVVVDALAEVIGWHHRHLLPLGEALTSDSRCRVVHADFFALAAGDGFDTDVPGRQFDAVIVDIDHSPRELLHPSHAGFYEPAGIARLAGHLRPGGMFSLWSNDPPDAEYEAALKAVFTDVRSEVVTFDSALQGREATNTVYVARRPKD